MIWSRVEVDVGIQHQRCGSQPESTTPKSEPPTPALPVGSQLGARPLAQNLIAS